MQFQRPSSRPRFLLIALLGIAVPYSLRAQATATDTNLAFDRADRESRAFMASLHCATQMAAARERGLFGPADSLGSVGQCVVLGNRTLALFLDTDSRFTRVTHLSAVDLSSNRRIAAPTDTAAMLAVARAEDAAVGRGMSPYAAANRQFVPISFRFAGDSIEVWLLPLSIITAKPWSVGGEWGMIYSPDGRTLGHEINHTDDFRLVAVPDTGLVHIASKQDAIPTFSEFLLANLLNELGREVTIDLGHRSSTLTGRGNLAVWVQLVRKR